VAQTPDNQLAKRLKQAMREAHLTQEDLAKRLGVSRSLVGHWTNGQRAPDSDAVGRIANSLQVDAAWLRGDQAMTQSATKKTNWDFPEPIPGQRDFGNANVWTVPADVKTEVREAGQNIKDAHDDKSLSTVMRMRVIELSGQEVKDFKEAAGWNELEKHIEAASGKDTKGKLARKLAAGLERVRSNPERLILLRIDDFGTTGLIGDETGKGPFAALVRNNLDTDKSSTGAGGSFGLGKAAHWRCSDVSTVFFNTVTPTHRARIIARSELTYHELDGGSRQHAGPGWFGSKGSLGYVESIDDVDLAKKLRLERDPLPPELRTRVATDFGASILVVAFQNPASEDPDDPAALVSELEREIAINFWPAIQSNRLAAIVEHEVNGHIRETRLVNASRFLPEHCAIYEKHQKGTTVESFENPGDVVAIPVPIRIPTCKVDRNDVLKHAAVEGEATLLVALADPDAPTGLRSSLVNTVAMVRGPLMVTQYANKGGIMVGARPFIGVLLAGDASGLAPTQKHIEQFLRASEPPAHDKWGYTDDLREMYERGAKTRLEDFLGPRINEALRKILRIADKSDSDGPTDLKRLLNLGGGPSGEAREALAMLRNVRPLFLGDRWEIKADVLVNSNRPDRPLKIEPYLALNVETGRPVSIAWATIEACPPAAGVLSKGSGFIVTKAVSRFSFRAITDPHNLPIDPSRCTARVALKLEVIK